MARPLRLEFPGALYHVTARGNERKAIYRTDEDRRRFLTVLAGIVEQFNLLLHAYVLMDNHYHLLIETLEANLGRAMHDLNGTYAQSYNRRHHRVGHLLQGRYKAPLVQHDAYLLELSRYIHLNPVRAGLVARADDYPWSSARAYSGKCSPAPFLTVAEVLGHFGGHLRDARRGYAAFLNEASNSPTPSPLDNLVGQTLLGDAAWVEAMRARIDVCMRAGRLPIDLGGELPAVRQVRCRPTLAQVISAVAAATRTTPELIYRRHSRVQARAVAMYLANKQAGLTQTEVGAVFGIRCFAVSKAVTGVERAVQSNRKLRRLLQRLSDALRGPPR